MNGKGNFLGKLTFIFAAVLLASVLNSSWAATPSNDLFANRQVISAPETITFNTSEATIEPGEPDHHVVTGRGHSLWWRLVAPASGVLNIHFSNRGMLMDVYRGNNLASLELIATTRVVTDVPSLPLGGVAFTVRAGDAFEISADGLGDGDGLGQMSTLLVPAPANDDLANATYITGTNVVIEGTNTTATVEPGEPILAVTQSGKTLWWQWQSPINGRAFIVPEWIKDPMFAPQPSSPTVCAIYAGNDLASLKAVTQGSTGWGYPLSFDVTNGWTRLIAVDTDGVPSGRWRLRLSQVNQAPNDQFAERLPLAGDHVTTTGQNIMASREPGEPPFSTNAPGHTVWWTWQAPGDGVVTIQGADQHGLFTGNSAASLTRVTTGNGVAIGRVSKGTTYQVGADGSEGFFTLDLEFLPQATNDAFATPMILTTGIVSFTNSLLTATVEPGEGLQSRQALGRTLWHSWTAPAGGEATVEVRGWALTPLVTVYQGESLKKLKVVAVAKANSGTEAIVAASFVARPGLKYLICVDGGLEYPGAGFFSFEFRFNRMRISNPAAGSVVQATRGVVCSITPPDPSIDGNVVAVDYYFVGLNGGVVPAGTATAAPFSLTLTDPPSGAVTLFAVARDDANRIHVTPRVPFTIRPANDDFSDRIVLSGYRWSTHGTAIGSTRESGEPRSPLKGGRGSIWWQWTAPASGTASLHFNNGALGVYTGPSLRQLRPVTFQSAEPTAGTFTQRFPVVQGTDYFFAADQARSLSSIGAFGGVTFDLELSATESGKSAPRALVSDPLQAASASESAASTTAFPRWSGVKLLDHKTLLLTARGSPGQQFVVETSIDLKSWVPWQTNTIRTDATTVSVPMLDGEARRFYRVVPLP